MIKPECRQQPHRNSQTMRIGTATIAAAILATGALAQSLSTLPSDLAGQYGGQHRYRSPDNNRYELHDLVEIVPVDARHAYVHIYLESFAGGHQCEIAGIAKERGRALVYVAPRSRDESARCTLTVRRQGAKLLWSAPEVSCRAYCGTNASLASGDLPWSSKRPIRHLSRLKQRAPYTEALSEWQTGKPDHP